MNANTTQLTRIGTPQQPTPQPRSRPHTYHHSKVVVVVPAYNEAATIAATIAALHTQTRPADRIIVVANNCTDNTADVARQAGAEVWTMRHNPHKKAGALNWAISQLLPDLHDRDMLLVTDADSMLTPGAIAAAEHGLHRRRNVGAVCADYYLPRQPGTLNLLQANEYARFSRWIWRRAGRAVVLSGVATLFEVAAVRRVIDGRNVGHLPGYHGELYHRDPATEDIELTFAVQAAGYRPRVAVGFLAATDAMPSLNALILQRVRWQRGMLDTLRLYRLAWWNAGHWARQIAIYVGSLMVPAYVAVLVGTWATAGMVPFDPRWLPVTALFAVERMVTVRRQGWRAVLLAGLLLPEWCYEQVRSWAYWRALWQTCRRTERVWINS